MASTKTRAQLMAELDALRQRMVELEQQVAGRQPAGEELEDKRTAELRKEIAGHTQAEKEIKNLAKFPSENPSPVLRLDRDGVILYANEASLPLLLEWGKTVGQIAPEFWRVSAAQALADRAGKAVDVELGVRTLSFALVPVADAGDVNLYGTDITERKRVEEALRESEQKFRSVVEQSSDGIVLADSQGIVIEWNRAQEQITGIQREAALGQPLWELQFQLGLDEQKQAPSAYAQVRQRIVDFLEQGHSPWMGQLVEREIRRPDGARRFVESVSFPIKTDKGMLVGSLMRDVTDRKQAEEIVQLRLRLMQFATTHSLEELFQKTLDEVGALTHSPIGFYHFVESDQKTLSLQAWSTKTIQEFCKAEGKGLHYGIDEAGVWVDCVHQRRPVIHNDYAALPHRKGMPPGHAPIVRELVVPIFKSDRIVAILGVGNKPQDYTEQDIQAVSYLADVAWEITERKRAEEELKRLYEQTQRDALAKVELLREVSHRVKNNLLAIIGLLLAEQRFTPLEGRDWVDALIDRITRRIEGLLQVHELLSESEWAPMRLSDLAAQIIHAALDILMPDRRVDVKILPSSIQVSPRQASNLALVINELTTNTIKHALAERQELCVTVRTEMEGDMIYLEYRDDGPGYPDEVLRGERQGVGIYLLRRLATETLRGTLTLANEGGAVTRLRIKTEEKNRT